MGMTGIPTHSLIQSNAEVCWTMQVTTVAASRGQPPDTRPSVVVVCTECMLRKTPGHSRLC